MDLNNNRDDGKRWTEKLRDDLSPAQKLTFKAMRVRAIEREESGPKSENNTPHIFSFICFIILVIAVFKVHGDDSNTADRDNNDNAMSIELSEEECIYYGLVILTMFFGVVVVTSNKYKKIYFPLCVYLPILAFIALQLFEENYIIIIRTWIGASSLLILWFVFKEVLYPKLIKSDRLLDRFGVDRLWSIQVIETWTMSYHRPWLWWRPNCTCMYDGEKNDRGLPHGSGRWFDEGYSGEILSGQWENGVPIAPYISHTYGSGDGIEALRIAYFVATDDKFSKTFSKPSNDNELTIGVAAVECSVNGHFYTHLPLAKIMLEPIPVQEDTMSNICKKLIHLHEAHEKVEKKIEVSVVGSRGLKVRDHVYTPSSGDRSLKNVEQVIVDVQRNTAGALIDSRKSLFMPNGASMSFGNSATTKRTLFGGLSARSLFDPRGSSLHKSSIMVLNDIAEDNEQESSILLLDSEDDDTDKEEGIMVLNDIAEDNEEKSSILLLDSEDDDTDKEERAVSFLKNQAGIEPEEDTPKKKGDHQRSFTKIAQLVVRDWTQTHKKEALIFFPGFSSPIKKSLEAFGQFLAMTKLTRHIYPIMYAWPTATLLSYRNASTISATQKNKDKFYLMLRSLSKAGIRNVHLMSHSMGAQSLLAMFENEDDKDLNSRSHTSLMFQAVPGFGDDTELEREGQQLMVCKNIILMNPDFSLEAFVDRAFLSIRRVCENITVLGDCGDVALKGSKLINGICNRIGRKQSHLLESNKLLKSYSKQFKYLSLGYDISLIYIPIAEEIIAEDNEPLSLVESGNKNLPTNSALLFQSVRPFLFASNRNVIEKQWLDVDVIDTTSLDTNIAGVRHCSFNMNSIILKDLAELILEGDRASRRSSLLQREGNMYTYCHAPSHVAM